MKTLLCTLICSLMLLSSEAQQSQWHNPQASTTDIIQGRHWNSDLKGTYSRLPDCIKDSLRPALWNLSKNSAGLSIQFQTNASKIQVKYTVNGAREMYHMPATAVSGVDLYATDKNGESLWCRAGWPHLGDTITYTYEKLEYRPNNLDGYTYRLYLPLYTCVTSLQIGVADSSSFKFITPNNNQKPIVAYGTSITQGACASRPAMAWTNIVSRQTKTPVINLGFSGHGQLDMPMFTMLGQIDAAAYIIDCLPNLIRDKQHIVYPNAIKGVQYLRTKTNAPIILAEHSGYMNELSSPEAFTAYNESNKELRRAYIELKKQGVKNLFYVTKQEINLSPDSQVDGVHPTDLGMQQYADAYTKALQKIFKIK